MHTAYLGIGANLGDREAAIAKAIEMLGERAGAVEAQSSLHRSAPWGYESANMFVNAVVRISTGLTPFGLLDTVQGIERALGKRQAHATQRAGGTQHGSSPPPPVYHDRPIDIDVLLYDDIAIDTPRLTIPHPLMRQRPFVMEPLREVLPAAVQ